MRHHETQRITSLEHRVERLEEELALLRAATAPPPVVRAPEPKPAPAPVLPESEPSPWVAPRHEPRRPRPSFTFDPAALFGARSLAITGGIVTLLGILFFFVLAVNRGWIGPGARVALGGIASAIVFSAGVWLRRRFGDTHSSLAAVGAGIAGGYATLLAATALYGLVSSAAALVVAVAIAATATVTALAWRSELVAGLGLAGAALAPLALAAQDGLSTTGTAFAAIVFAGTAAVAVHQSWRWLLVAAAAATFPQIGGLVTASSGRPIGVVVVMALFSLLYVAAATAWHLRHDVRLSRVTAAFVALATWLSVGAVFDLWTSSRDRGLAVVVAAVVLAGLAAAFFRPSRTKDLSALLAAAALTAAAIAFGELLSGRPLTYAWAGEAAALAWLSRRVREIRYQLFALAYVAMAAIRALVLDAPPARLFVEGRHPGAGALPVVATALAVAVFGVCARRWRDEYEGVFAHVVRAFHAAHPVWRHAAFWVAGVLAAYAAALGLVQLLEWSGAGFDWGHVAVDGVWAAAGLAILLVGFRRGVAEFANGGFAWLAATAGIAATYDTYHLATTPRSVAYLIVGGAGLVAAVAAARQAKVQLVANLPAVPVVASLGFALAGAVLLAGSEHLIGASLLGLAAVYLGTAIVLRRQRDLRTLAWAIALLLSAAAAPLLLERTWVVLAWAAASAAVSLAAARLGERRLLVGALGYLVLALGDALVLRAPPNDLFTPHVGPANGVPALLLALAALVMLARCVRRRAIWWTGGVVALYAVSLSILELVEKIGGSLDASFHSGHSVISAVWGLLGLALLYVGLTRRPALRVAGFALFAVSVAKLFLFDLPSLSAVTRALSFLAVGALLLLGGFFYQRLRADNSGQASLDG